MITLRDAFSEAYRGKLLPQAKPFETDYRYKIHTVILKSQTNLEMVIMSSSTAQIRSRRHESHRRAVHSNPKTEELKEVL